MPKVNSSVKAAFLAGTHFGAGLFPDEAVAIGATTQAFLLQVGLDADHLLYSTSRWAVSSTAAVAVIRCL